MVHAEREIMLQYCFPRLDMNVSKGINHLLKSPFSVHPKTGQLLNNAPAYFLLMEIRQGPKMAGNVEGGGGNTGNSFQPWRSLFGLGHLLSLSLAYFHAFWKIK